MKNRIALIFLLSSNLFIATQANQKYASSSDATNEQKAVLTVRNSESIQRNEVVEIDLNKLPFTKGDFRIKNARGQQVGYQKTYDGKLLIEASVRPKSSVCYYISKGLPKEMKKWVCGRMYPEREDDIAWENDRGAYRIYGPALQKTGERAYGIDVWVKNTPDLVVENRYSMELSGVKEIQRLEKEGKDSLAFETRLDSSFHFDHGYGYDPYNVGPSLGCGTPAILKGNELMMPWCYESYNILDNGPLRFTVSLTYPKNADGIIEHRIISLDKGSNFNRMTVWYEGGKQPLDIAAGIVIHKEDTTTVDIQPGYVEYADPTDNITVNASQIYVAALFPSGNIQTKYLGYGNPSKEIAGHAIGICRNLKPKDSFVYFFGAAWSKADVQTQKEWKLRIEEKLENIAHPLIVEIR